MSKTGPFHRNSALAFCCLFLQSLGAQTGSLLHLEESLVWNLSEYEAETGAQWQTVQFPTLPGALYTLTSSSDLEYWEPIESFYAVGTELELALFERVPAPASEPPNGGNQGSPEEPEPIKTVQFRLRPVEASTSLLVTWSSLDETTPDFEHSQTLSVSLNSAWDAMPFYTESFDSFFFFISALYRSPVDPASLTTSTLVPGSIDAEVFQRLQLELSGIQQTVANNYQIAQNSPVPPPPHPNSKSFYRLERSFPDSDGDGLFDYYEFLSTQGDPFNPDTDGDGILDGQEDTNGNGIDDQEDQENGNDAGREVARALAFETKNYWVTASGGATETSGGGGQSFWSRIWGDSFTSETDQVKMSMETLNQRFLSHTTELDEIDKLNPSIDFSFLSPLSTIAIGSDEEEEEQSQAQNYYTLSRIQHASSLWTDGTHPTDTDLTSYQRGHLEGFDFRLSVVDTNSAEYDFDYVEADQDQTMTFLQVDMQATVPMIGYEPSTYRRYRDFSNQTFPSNYDYNIKAEEWDFECETLSITIPQGQEYTDHFVDAPELESGKVKFRFLLPVDIKVDANRDGEITGADQTTPETPYRFWINSDADEQEDEEPEGSSIDYLNNTIDTRRDLEDFSRLWLNIGGFHEQLKSGEVQLGFKWTETTGNPIVKIYWAADEKGGNNYLKEQADASAQIAVTYNSAVAIPSAGSTAFVDKKVFENIDSADGWVYFLFEGSSEGKGKLTSVLKFAEAEEVEAASVDLNLLHVRRMYERVKVTPSPADAIADPPEAVNIGWAWDPWNYPPDYDPEEEDQYLVFVHGWNMTYSGSQKFGETMFKRLWHQGYKGRYAFVRWPTYFGVLTYNDSDYRAWKSGVGLASFVNSLPIQYERKLCAHSMGNVVASSALREGMNVDYYGLLNAAVPAMCYDSSPTLYSNNFATPDGDTDPATNALGFKKKINAVNGANLINFYLPQDHALGVWTVNNFNFKPDSNKGYTYNPLGNSGEKLYQQGFVSRRYLTTFHEAGAFATKSRTHTVGALGNTNGVIGSKVNLDARYNFGDIHSAEWELNSQGTFDFYSDLMDEMFLD